MIDIAEKLPIEWELRRREMQIIFSPVLETSESSFKSWFGNLEYIGHLDRLK